MISRTLSHYEAVNSKLDRELALKFPLLVLFGDVGQTVPDEISAMPRTAGPTMLSRMDDGNRKKNRG
jgi:hypothetical protein